MRTRQQFDADLLALQNALVEMGSNAGEMLSSAIHALTTGDSAEALAVIERDDIVDQFDINIEAECMRLVIQQQPIARDLRVIGTVYKAITDIERIADHAVDIAKIARQIAAESRYEPLVDIALLTKHVSTMYRDAIQALQQHNIEVASRVVLSDDLVDDMFHDQRAALLVIMKDRPECRILASNLIFVAQFLERIGDRSVNIAERVLQMELITVPRDREEG
jgi:phosphate transport system protein